MASYTETGGYCGHCEDRVLVRRRSTNHVLQLLLCVVTFGLWIPIWFLTSVRFGGWLCAQCGSRASTSIPRSARKRARGSA